MLCCLHQLDVSTATVFLQCYAAYNILISRLRLYFAILCCLHHLHILNYGNLQCYAAYTILKARLKLYFAKQCCIHNLVYLDSDYILLCYAYTILISRLTLYFAMLCYIHHLDISTETVFCNAMLLTRSWYLDWDCTLQCYAYTILISRLRLYSEMICCLHNLAISTETVICNAILITQSWYLDWDCILQCYAAQTIFYPTENAFSNAFLLTSAWYLDRDCVLQCFAAYTILISRLRLYLQCFAAYTILKSRLRLYFAMLCCLTI